MKSKFAVLAAIQLLMSCVGAVLVHDAYVKDWISYNYGDLVRCSILSPSTALCISKSNILYQIGVSDASIKYFIDLDTVSNNDFVVAGSSIVSYTIGTPKVAIWDMESGILSNELTFDGNVERISEYDGRVTVVLDSGSIEAIASDTSIVKDGIEGPQKSVDILYSTLRQKLFSEYSVGDKLLDGILNETIFDKATEIKLLTDGTARYLAVVSTVGILVGNISDLSKSSIPTFLVSLNGDFEDIRIFGNDLVVLTSDYSNLHFSVRESGHGVVSELSFTKSQLTFRGKALLVDKPLSLSTIDEVQHLVEETHSKSVLYRWLLRTKTHLSQLGKFASKVLSNRDFMSGINDISKDQFGFHKILVFYDDTKNELVAKESNDGLLLWSNTVTLEGEFIDLIGIDTEVLVVSSHLVVAIDMRSGEVLRSETFSETIDEVFKIWCEKPDGQDEVEIGFHVAGLRFGDHLKTWGQKNTIAPSQFILSKSEDYIRAYKLAGEKLITTWSFSTGDQIVSVTKNTDELTSAIGITRFDRSVLYKYLNPNLITVVSVLDASLKVTLIDGITGSVLHVQEHTDEVIDPTSVEVVQNDNWIIYSFRVNYPYAEQRVVVIDLFATSESALGGDLTVLDGSYNSSIATISTKSFLFPEKILAMKPTVTKFGITTRSVIALTDSGSLIELPKFILNSRRIDDRKMTQQDAEDDFRLMPYEPVVNINTRDVLNHKRKLQLSSSPQQILARPTGLESSGIICFINEFNEFCTVVQPSSSYDMLSGSFEGIKLLMTIVALLIAYVASKPFVYSRKLNDKWLD